MPEDQQYNTHESLVEFWDIKYPREKLIVDEKASFHGKEMLKQLKQFELGEVKAAIKRVIADDKPKTMPRVVAFLKNHSRAQEAGPTWIENATPGTIFYKSGKWKSRYGMVVHDYGSEMWIVEETRVNETPYFAMVLPKDLEVRWADVDINRTIQVKDEWRDGIREGKYDGGAPSRAFVRALFGSEDTVDDFEQLFHQPQAKRHRPKPNGPESISTPKATVMRLGEVKFRNQDLVDMLVPDEGTNAPKKSTVVPGSSIGLKPDEGCLY
jgi:hypothetical protein